MAPLPFISKWKGQWKSYPMCSLRCDSYQSVKFMVVQDINGKKPMKGFSNVVTKVRKTNEV